MKYVTIDFETRYDAEYSLSKMSMTDYLLDERFKVLGFTIVNEEGKAMWVPEGKVDATLAAMRPHLEQRTVVAHNALFDHAILSWHFDILPKVSMCTLAMARANGFDVIAGGNSLGKLMAYFGLGEKAPLSPNSTPEELRERATTDAVATHEIFAKLVPLFNLDELRALDWTIRAYTEPRLIMDRNLLEKVMTEYDQNLANALAKCGYEAADMNSPAKFADALIKLGVEPPTKISPKLGTEAWAFAKTDEGFQELLNSDDEDVACLAAARLGAKSGGEADRAERLHRASAFGRVGVPLNYAATHTLRHAGTDKMNWQNFKRGGYIRRAILPPTGDFEIGVGDLSQIEARMVAWLCGCDTLTQAFAAGRDVYSEFGTEAFGYPVSKATEYERFSSKTTVLGSGYGAGAKTLTKQAQAEVRKRGLKMQAPELATYERLVNAYRTNYREIPQGWDDLELLLEKAGREFGPVVSGENCIILPNTLRLNYHNLKWERYKVPDGGGWKEREGWRYDTRRGRTATWGGKLMENVASSLAGVLFRWQLVRLDADLRKMGGSVVTTTHDEMVTIYPIRVRDEAVNCITHWMSQKPAWAEGLPVACEVGTGPSYGEAKK